MGSRFLALRVRPANRDIPLNDDAPARRNRHATLVTAAHLFSHQTAAHLPKSNWGSLSLYGVLKELQRVLAVYLGYCPHCRQRAPT